MGDCRERAALKTEYAEKEPEGGQRNTGVNFRTQRR